MNLGSFGKGALQVIGTVAPWIGTAIGGPFGAVAGKFVHDAIATATGAAPGTTLDAKTVESAIMGSDPATLLALKNADLAFKTKMEELDVTRDQLVYADVANARSRDVSYIQAGRRNYRADFLALAAVATFAWAFYMLWNSTVPAPNKDMTVYLLGILTAMVKDLYGFEFGSSRGSQDKTAAMSDALTSQPPK